MKLPLKGIFERSSTELRPLQGVHSGEDCLLICNGPSLNKVDFSRIDRSRLSIFGTNKIFLGLDRFDISLDYYAAVNAQVLEQASDDISELDAVKFISDRASSFVRRVAGETHFINTTRMPSTADRFSDDISRYVHEGWTVTHVALQIIKYLGFDRVFIVGMDHRFSQAKPASANHADIIAGPDGDHFDPRYFGYGQSWDQPDIENSEISYHAALESYEASGKEIVDCTIDGACAIFPRASIEDTLYTRSSSMQSKLGHHEAADCPDMGQGQLKASDSNSEELSATFGNNSGRLSGSLIPSLRYYGTRRGKMVLLSIILVVSPVPFVVHSAYGWSNVLIAFLLLELTGVAGLLVWIAHFKNSIEDGVTRRYGNTIRSLRAELRSQSEQIQRLSSRSSDVESTRSSIDSEPTKDDSE